VLTVVAVGYGIDLADRPSALEALAGRLGGILHVSGTPGRRIAFRVDLPRHR
jgi:hypothetical protein